jgi:hypothetical protein
MNLKNNFTYHPPTEHQVSQYEEIRDQAHRFARLIQDCCPDSREKSLAITKLEECVMWANASIARNE